jgi:hypothetical protein
LKIEKELNLPPAPWAESGLNGPAHTGETGLLAWSTGTGTGCIVPRWHGLPRPKAAGPAHDAWPVCSQSSAAWHTEHVHGTRHGTTGD